MLRMHSLSTVTHGVDQKQTILNIWANGLSLRWVFLLSFSFLCFLKLKTTLIVRNSHRKVELTTLTNSESSLKLFPKIRTLMLYWACAKEMSNTRRAGHGRKKGTIMHFSMIACYFGCFSIFPQGEEKVSPRRKKKELKWIAAFFSSMTFFVH